MFNRYFNAEPFEAVRVSIGIVVLLMGVISAIAYGLGGVRPEVGIIFWIGINVFWTWTYNSSYSECEKTRKREI
ncbi:MAG: hypothetical protein JKX76_03770 [Colwellia sp.]|nr:hypothetical protein [Colwellia sp.]